jgi:hypothetical protein
MTHCAEPRLLIRPPTLNHDDVSAKRATHCPSEVASLHQLKVDRGTPMAQTTNFSIRWGQIVRCPPLGRFSEQG